MATLQPGTTYRYLLAAGETLAITTDGTGAARYGQLAAQPTGGASDVPAGSMIAVPANSSITIGPRADASRWLIDGVTGTVTVTQNLASPIVPQAGAPADLLHLYGAGVPS